MSGRVPESLADRKERQARPTDGQERRSRRPRGCGQRRSPVASGGFLFSGARSGAAVIWQRYGGPKQHENARVASVVRAGDIPSGHGGRTDEQRK